MKLKLRTTLAQFDELHSRLAQKRRSKKFITVEVDALRNLLLDHSRLNAALRGEIQED